MESFQEKLLATKKDFNHVITIYNTLKKNHMFVDGVPGAANRLVLRVVLSKLRDVITYPCLKYMLLTKKVFI